MWWFALAWLLVTWAIAEWTEWGRDIPKGGPTFKVLSTLVVAAAWPISLPVAFVRTVRQMRTK